MKNLGQMWQWLPWVSDVFLGRFPLSVMSVLWSASSVAPAFFRPPNSVRRPREKLKTSGTQGRRDILCVCIKSEFGRVMRPDIVVQMRDSSWRRTVYYNFVRLEWRTEGFVRLTIHFPLRLCDDNWSQLAFLEGFYMIESLEPNINEGIKSFRELDLFLWPFDYIM